MFKMCFGTELLIQVTTNSILTCKASTNSKGAAAAVTCSMLTEWTWTVRIVKCNVQFQEARNGLTEQLLQPGLLLPPDVTEQDRAERTSSHQHLNFSLTLNSIDILVSSFHNILSTTISVSEISASTPIQPEVNGISSVVLTPLKNVFSQIRCPHYSEKSTEKCCQQFSEGFFSSEEKRSSFHSPHWEWQQKSHRWVSMDQDIQNQTSIH